MLQSTPLGPDERNRLARVVRQYDASHAEATAAYPSALTDVIIAGIREGRLARDAMDEVGRTLGDFLKRTGGRASMAGLSSLRR